MNAANGRGLSAGASAVLIAMGLAADARAAGKPPEGAVSAQTVRLPSGPGSVRGLAPDPEVSPFSGQASYAIPLELPKTSRGFAPAIDLSYHGELGNGPLGIGWSVGVPMIRRSTHDGVPSYSATDELHLSGVGSGGRLVAISPTEYRVEGQGNSVRVLASGSGFQVWGPDGTRYDLGLGAASQLASGTRVATWYVQEMVDVAGQHVAFSYRKDQGQIYLERVSWGPNDVFAAVFELGPRADVIVSWSLGFSVKTALRAGAVRIESFGEVLRRYELGYDETFAVSRLQRVRALGRGGADALPAVTFGYAGRAEAAAQLLDVGNWRLGQTTVLADVDGDGAADLVDLQAGSHSYRQNRGGSFGPATALTGATNISLSVARLADVEGRARPNLIALSGGFWQPYRIQGTKWVGLGQWQGTQNLPLSGANMAVTDVNGDGRVDVVEWNTVGLQMRLGGAQGLASAVSRPRIAGVLLPNAATRWGDVNGDGLVDVMQQGAATIATYLGRGDGTFEPAQSVPYPGGVPGPTDDLRFGDLNRDGLLDGVRVSQAQVRWYPGRADGTFAATPITLPRPSGADSDSIVSLEDANGNGSEDVVWSSPTGMWALDMAGPTNAGMLVSVDNGMGKTLAIAYEATTALAGRDADAGEAWTWHLPIAIPVVVQTTVGTGAGDPARIIAYAVRNGFWDTSEHRFGGFLNSIKVTRGGADGDLIEETRFHSGSGVQRVLRGQPVQVTRAIELAGVRTTLDVTTNTWRAMRIPSLPDLPLLRKAVLDQSRTEFLEGRPAGSPLVTRTTTTYDTQGRVIVEANEGRLDLPGDDKRIERSWASDDATWVRDLPVEEKTLGPGGTLVGWTRTFYGDDDELLPLGQAGKGWARRVEAWLAGEDRWVVRQATDYDALGNPIHIEEKGVARDLTYDALRLFATDETIDLGGRQLSWHADYDLVLGLPISATGPDGVEMRQSYDGLGRPTAVRIGSANPHVVYRYIWEAPRPRTETFQFDGPLGAVTPLPATWTPSSKWRHVIAVTNGAGDALYQMTRIDTDRWLVSDWREYDVRGNPSFHGEHVEWQGGWAVTARPPGMVGQTLRFDAAKRLVEQVLPNGEHKLVAHSAFTAATTTDGLGTITLEKDAHDRVVANRRDTELARVSYDAAGRVLDYQLFRDDPLVPSALHSYRYDTLGRTVRVESSDHGARLMQYDEGDRMTSLQNAAGQSVALTYDAAGRLTSRQLSNGTAFQYHHDLARPGSGSTFTGGRLAWVEEPTGTVELGYDALGNMIDRARTIDGRVGRRTAVYAPSGIPVHVELDESISLDLGYDAAGRLISIGDLWQAESLDAAGRVLAERYGNGVEQTTSRDELGLPSRIDVEAPGGAVLYGLGVTRHEWGGVATLVDDDGSGLDHSASFTYDTRGRLTGATLGAAANPFQFGYSYDDLQNMTARTASGPAALGSFRGDYRYGEGGRGPRQLTSIGGSGATPHTFGYDAAGRQTQQDALQMEFNALDQLLAVSGLPGSASVTHAYGFDGHRLKTAGPGGVKLSFGEGITEVGGARQYDLTSDDRVVARIIAPLAGEAEEAAAIFGTEELGRGMWMAVAIALALSLFAASRRSGRTRSARATASTAVALLLTGCGTGATTRSARTALTVGQRVVYFHQGIGAGPELFTDDDGAVLEERRYEPFGAPIDALRPAGAGQVDFASVDQSVLNRPVDPATGWSDHGARWFAPETARWLSIDPPTMEALPELAEKPWSIHPYQYTDQNPVLYWDPDGRQPAKVNAPADLLDKRGYVARFFGRKYELNKEARDLLGPIFKTHFNYDVSDVVINFGWTFGADAYTWGDYVVLNEDKWDNMTPRQRVKLIAHEIVHSVQYARYGNTSFINFSATRFLWRYRKEYGTAGNYIVPTALANMGIGSIDPIDKNFTLDQIAERIADEVMKGVNP
jgi:RHS repeat-associated protein